MAELLFLNVEIPPDRYREAGIAAQPPQLMQLHF